MVLSERLNLELSWLRVKNDLKYECFVNHPYQIYLIESDFNLWLNSIRDTIDDYKPRISPTIDVPKKNWHIRPVNVLEIEDHVIYASLVLDMIENIKRALSWSSNSKRFSYILKENQKTKYWLEYGNPWLTFNEISLDHANNYEYVLFTDISAFFENINIKRLIYDLDNIGIERDNKNLLRKCLFAWAKDKENGIPQGYTTSSILAEVYLDSIDKQLDREGYIHTRFADDMRIFCSSHKNAVEALHFLTRECRKKGLNLQTAKSDIIKKEDAIRMINGINPTINDIDENIKQSLKDVPLYRNDLNQIRIHHENLNLELVFNNYFIQTDYNKFNVTLFHYLIYRLGTPVAVEYCFDLILIKPEETKHILNYFSNLKKNGYIIQDIAEDLSGLLLNNNRFPIYEYQKFLFLKWLWKNNIISKNIMKNIRKLLNSEFMIQQLKDYCIAYLGENGDSADLDTIESLYSKCNSEITKATIIYGLRNMKKDRRNVLYSQVEDGSNYLQFAVKLAKSKSLIS